MTQLTEEEQVAYAIRKSLRESSASSEPITSTSGTGAAAASLPSGAASEVYV